ncbi:unnamed protein product [Toxocara canis]|uniref:Uncharacterized protein n=1 Tax=Toxocara canis TaxID=6265 RepID=A0A183U1U0_TOXCA|nr:unnamed protein product [Toxocara canis]
MADGTTARFHSNQLRKRVTFDGQQNHTEHQWVTLQNAFGLPNPATAAETTSAKISARPQPSKPPEMSNTAQPPLRRSTRRRAPPVTLGMDPRRKRYQERPRHVGFRDRS